jgi:hypothetical protein
MNIEKTEPKSLFLSFDGKVYPKSFEMRVFRSDENTLTLTNLVRSQQISFRGLLLTSGSLITRRLYS